MTDARNLTGERNGVVLMGDRYARVNIYHFLPNVLTHRIIKHSFPQINLNHIFKWTNYISSGVSRIIAFQASPSSGSDC